MRWGTAQAQEWAMQEEWSSEVEPSAQAWWTLDLETVDQDAKQEEIAKPYGTR